MSIIVGYSDIDVKYHDNSAASRPLYARYPVAGLLACPVPERSAGLAGPGVAKWPAASKALISAALITQR
jgi:hypothetical protein